MTSGVLAQSDVNIPVGKFKADYYNGKSFNTFVATREDEKIDFNWGSGSPLTGVNSNDFSAKWEGYFFFDAGTYTFTISSDDGSKVYVDDQLLISSWQVQSGRQLKATKTLDNKAHKIKVEYFEMADGASIHFNWAKTSDSTSTTSTGSNTGGSSKASTVSSCVGLSVSQITGVAPFTVRFTASGNDPKGSITGYEFTLGEQINGKIKMVTQESNQLIYTYTVPGTYTASVRIKDSNGDYKGGNIECSKKITVTGTLKALNTEKSDKLPETGVSDYIPSMGLAAMFFFGIWAYKKFKTV